MTKIVLWELDGCCGRGIKLGFIDHFDARGMRRVYGRCDHCGRGPAFYMDVWLTRSGRVLARFWSRSSEVDGVSFEIVGVSRTPPASGKKYELDELWVPQCLRDEYDNWILSEMWFPAP
jgi:hypothetical protein